MSKVLIVIILTVLLSSPVLAGVVLEIIVKDQRHPTNEMSTVKIADKRLAMNIVSGMNNAPDIMIYLGDQREMIVVSTRDKNYMVIDRQSLQALAGQYNKAMSQMEQMMKSLPPEQRAMMERLQQQQALPRRTPATSELRKTGLRAMQVGYPCAQYEIWQAGRKRYELWVTDWDKMDGGMEAREALQAMAAFFRDMQQSFSGANSTSSASGDMQFGDSFFAYMDQLNGFPVITKEWQGDTLQRESTLQSVRQETIPTSAFKPPSNFNERQMFGQH